MLSAKAEKLDKSFICGANFFIKKKVDHLYWASITVDEGALIRLTFLSGTNRIVFFFSDIKKFWKWAV